MTLTPEQQAKFADCFVVWVSVRHSRMNGSYVVKAANRRDARKVINGATPHLIESTQTFVDYCEEMGDEIESTLQDILNQNADGVNWAGVDVGGYVEIEFGT